MALGVMHGMFFLSPFFEAKYMEASVGRLASPGVFGKGGCSKWGFADCWWPWSWFWPLGYWYWATRAGLEGCVLGCKDRGVVLG